MEYLPAWYKNASVRARDYITLKRDSSYPFFPEELLPICRHPIIEELGEGAKNYILTQLCYKYLQEICITETDVVIPTCLNIAYGTAPLNLSEVTKSDAFSIIVDEAFHSYVAKSFMLQVQLYTEIEPLVVPRENEVTKAIAKIKKNVPYEIQNGFELIATSISENIFTDEIIRVSRLTQVNESFHQLMVDHARDEGRHAGYFVRIMRTYWEQIGEEEKALFVKIIPDFLNFCLDGEHETEFLEKVLGKCKLSKNSISMLLIENQNEITKVNRVARMTNILRCLQRSSLLSYEPLANAFDASWNIRSAEIS